MDRGEALELLKAHLKDERMVKHCVAVEAIMRALARRLGEDEELWGLVGLLHDIDYDEVGRDPSRHGLEALRILEGKLPRHALEAIAAHNEHNGFRAGSGAERLLHALRAADHASGLIVATALVMPGKKLAEVKPETARAGPDKGNRGARPEAGGLPGPRAGRDEERGRGAGAVAGSGSGVRGPEPQ